MEFSVGDSVVTEDWFGNRGDLHVVTIDSIKRTPKQTKYNLSDGTSTISERKMYLIKTGG